MGVPTLSRMTFLHEKKKSTFIDNFLLHVELLYSNMLHVFAVLPRNVYRKKVYMKYAKRGFHNFENKCRKMLILMSNRARFTFILLFHHVFRVF